MSLIYFEDREGYALAIVASKVVALRRNRYPTDTPVSVITETVIYNVRGDIDTAQQKLIAALRCTCLTGQLGPHYCEVHAA